MQALSLWKGRLLSAIILILIAETGLAKNYEKGLLYLRKKDYERSLEYLERALERQSSRREVAEIYKLMGINLYYTEGSRAAQDAFYEALRLNPNVTITHIESKSKKIHRIFNWQKESLYGSSASQVSLGLKLLPLGLPQYKAGKTTKGSFILGTQLISLYVVFERDLYAFNTQKTLDEARTLQAQTASSDPIEFQTFERRSQDAISEALFHRDLAIGSFFLIYAYSLVDVFFIKSSPQSYADGIPLGRWDNSQIAFKPDYQEMSLNLSFRF